MPLLLWKRQIRDAVPKTPILLLCLRQNHTDILSPNLLFSLDINLPQRLIQSLEKSLFDLSSTAGRQKYMHKDVLVTAIHVEIVPREDELVRFMFSDDLKVVSL